MATDFSRRRWTIRNPPRFIDEEITPSSGWTQYPDFHHLLVDLPGFGKNDIKFNVDESGIILVSGKRKIGEEKQVHFEKSFNVPEDGDIKNINTVFEGDTLKVSIPRVAKEMNQKPQKTNGDSISSNNSSEDAKEEEEKAKTKVDQSETTEEPMSETNNNSSIDKKDQNQVIGRETSNKGENSSSHTSVIVKIIENKGILIASILSFTLGVFLSQKIYPLPPPK